MEYETNGDRPTEDQVRRAQAVHDRIRDKYWCLTGGYVYDWAFGAEPPPPVPNRSMPWKRPEFRDTLRRLVEFDQRPEYVLEWYGKTADRGGWRGVHLP